MILNFEKEVQEIVTLLGGSEGYSAKTSMEVSMVLFTIFDRGFAEGRERAIKAVQRMAINPMPIVAEIRKPIR